MRAERIAYVIDFSSSMGSEGRADLMRRELTKSLGNITHGTRYGVIFFSCIAWEAGDNVNLDRKRGHAVVRGEDGRPFEWKDLGGKQGWKQAGIPQRADWLIASQNQLARSKKIVKGAPLSSGTAWDKGLNMALDMTPLPRSEEHTSELQSRRNFVCRLLLEKKNGSLVSLVWISAFPKRSCS